MCGSHLNYLTISRKSRKRHGQSGKRNMFKKCRVLIIKLAMWLNIVLISQYLAVSHGCTISKNINFPQRTFSQFYRKLSAQILSCINPLIGDDDK